MTSLERDLPAFLARQRWFAGKARVMEATTVARRAALPGEPHLEAVVVDVKYADGTSDLYQLLVDADGDGDRSLDAIAGTGAAERLLACIAEGAVTNDIAFQTFESFDPRAGNARVSQAEQSNTSVVFGDSLILKWFRRLAAGVQPEVEVTRALAAAGFDNVARPYGTMEWRTEPPMTGAAVQEFLPDAEDAWRLAVASAAGGADIAAAVEELGAVTAMMHVTLAAVDEEGFGSRSVAAADRTDWAASMADELDALLRMPTCPSLLKGARADLTTALERINHVSECGRMVRVHGDYHLGQVLRSRRRWVILDFEGEPSRPLEERRALRSPLVDVAGMLRSLDYAARTAAQEGVSQEEPEPDWLARQRAAFLSGYRDAVGDAGLVPADDGDFDALLGIFELRKAFYEVGYEMSHRPDWLPIPLAAVERILSST